jgi:hypothetical protein
VVSGGPFHPLTLRLTDKSLPAVFSSQAERSGRNVFNASHADAELGVVGVSPSAGRIERRCPICRSVGFDLLLIRSTGLLAFDYSFWGDYFRYSNFLAYRQEDKHLLESIVSQRT